MKISLDLSPTDRVVKGIKAIIKKSVTKNSKPIAAALKANLSQHKRTGAASKSISTKTKTYKDVVVSIVGPKSAYQVTLGSYVRGKHKGEPRVYRVSRIFHLIERGSKRFAGRGVLAAARSSTAAAFEAGVTEDVRHGIEQLSQG